MDFLRSCYSTSVRFFRNDPTQTEIVWYFVPEDRPFLPYPNAFASRNWDDARTDWPVGKDGPPAGDGSEVGEVLGAPRPWRDGSDPVQYPGTHALGTADQFANGLQMPPLVFENVCRTSNAFGYPIAHIHWATDWGDAGDDPPFQAMIPCEGLEAIVRSVFEGRDIRSALKLGVFTTLTQPIFPFATYADFVQPADPAYSRPLLPASSFVVNQFHDLTECYWYAAHDVIWLRFSRAWALQGWFITCELVPGNPRVLWWNTFGDGPINVPFTGGLVGITLLALGFIGREVSA